MVTHWEKQGGPALGIAFEYYLCPDDYPGVKRLFHQYGTTDPLALIKIYDDWFKHLAQDVYVDCAFDEIAYASERFREYRRSLIDKTILLFDDGLRKRRIWGRYRKIIQFVNLLNEGSRAWPENTTGQERMKKRIARLRAKNRDKR